MSTESPKQLLGFEDDVPVDVPFLLSQLRTLFFLNGIHFVGCGMFCTKVVNAAFPSEVVNVSWQEEVARKNIEVDCFFGTHETPGCFTQLMFGAPRELEIL